VKGAADIDAPSVDIGAREASSLFLAVMNVRSSSGSSRAR
jgi:hypothetical protein